MIFPFKKKLIFEKDFLSRRSDPVGPWMLVMICFLVFFFAGVVWSARFYAKVSKDEIFSSASAPAEAREAAIDQVKLDAVLGKFDLKAKKIEEILSSTSTRLIDPSI